MIVMNNIFKYPMKRRKKSLFSAFCLLAVIYVGFQIIYFEDEYSPLQLLSSVENEANRLLHFITQAQIQCNSSVATNNLSLWLICQDVTLDVPPDLASARGIVYSVGSRFNSGFEAFIDRNSSFHQYIFSPFKSKQWENFGNQTSFLQTSVVPNDPSDFARNSFHSQTLNFLHEMLKHNKISIAKIDRQQEVGQSHELLHFLIEDSWLDHVKELHFVLQLDKVEEDDIYNWYRVVYSLFHKSGFRLYHISASNSLCLQDTIMESCKYYLSWLRAVPPHAFVLYPPAIDGSMGYEEERMTQFLDEYSTNSITLSPVQIKLALPTREQMKPNETLPQAQLVHFKLAKAVVGNAHSCTIVFILNSHAEYVSGLKNSRCIIISLKPILNTNLGVYSFQSTSYMNTINDQQTVFSLDGIYSILEKTKVSIMVVETGASWDSWGILTSMLSHGIPKVLDELIVETSIFQHDSRPQPMVLRKKYSALKQIEAFGFFGVEWEKHIKDGTLHVEGQEEIVTLNFVKKKYQS